MTEKRRKKSRTLQTKGAFDYVMWAIIFVWCVCFVFILYWALITSLKDSYEVRYYPTKLPQIWQWENYINAFKNIKVRNGTTVVYFPELLKNTLIYNLGVPLVSNIVVCLTTYIAARYKNLGWTSMIFTVYLITCYMPSIGSTASIISFMQRLRLYDKWSGVFLMNAGGFGGGFLIYYGAWKSFSQTYAEAAQTDGATHLQIFFKIMFPMILPVFFVMTLSTVRSLWDTYTVTLVYLPSYPTLSYAAYNLINGAYDDLDSLQLPNQIAYYIIFSLPMLILYYATKNSLVKASGFSSGIKA